MLTLEQDHIPSRVAWLLRQLRGTLLGLALTVALILAMLLLPAAEAAR